MELSFQAPACILLVHYFTHTLPCPCCNIPCILLLHTHACSHSRDRFTTFHAFLPSYTSHARMLTLTCTIHIQICFPSRQLRSSADTRLLRLPSAHLKSSGERAFLHQGPLLWNNLPYSLRHSSSIPSFKFALKTHLLSSGL